MDVTRRKLLFAGGLGLLAAMDPLGVARGVNVASARPAGPVPSAAVDPSTLPWTGATTTLEATLVRGQDISGGKGYRDLAVAAGEPHLLRTELTTVRMPPTIPLKAFAHMSDLHCIDDQSPGRLEFMDEYDDVGAPHFHSYGTFRAYRAHEMLSTQIVEAMCSAIRKLERKGPATGQPLDFTIITGDKADNAQYNETRWAIDILDGGKSITPDSGTIGVDESVASIPQFRGDFKSWNYWHPDGNPPYFGFDRYKDRGFPVIAGLLAAARQPFQSGGLGMPWYTAYGNHDMNVQGNIYANDPAVPLSLDLNKIVVGNQKPVVLQVEIPDKISGFSDYVGVLQTYVYAAFDPNGTLGVYGATADANRRYLTRQQSINEHFITTGTPAGHGYTQGSPHAYYVMPSAADDRIRFICLDTVQQNSSNGKLHPDQIDFLHDTLIANSSSYYILNISDLGEPRTWSLRHQPGVQDKLFVVYCHHTIDQTDNGNDLLDILLSYPNVIALVNGHTHWNRITPYARTPLTPGGPGYENAKGGFWEINLGAHIEWPCQSRIIEIAAAEKYGTDQTISIFTTMVDVDAPITNHSVLGDPRSLAGLARELASNDVQMVDFGVEFGADGELTDDVFGRKSRGDAVDRNTRLLVPAPFAIAGPPVPTGKVVGWGPDSGLTVGASGVAVITPTDNRWRQVGAAQGIHLRVHVNGGLVAQGERTAGWNLDALQPAETNPDGVVVQFVAGGGHALALRQDGTVFAIGDNSSGQLGDESTQNQLIPVNPHNLQAQRITQVSAGGTFSAAVDAMGRVWTWGDNSALQLGAAGTGGGAPAVVSGISDVVQVSAGGSHVLALRANGEVWAWGSNSNGQIGTIIGTPSGPGATATPRQILGTGFVQVAAGATHSLALHADGRVLAWGTNEHRELGDGTTFERHVPSLVGEGLPGGITQIGAGTNASGAIDGATGALWTWGAASNPARGTDNVQGSGAYGYQFALGDGRYYAVGDELGPPLPPSVAVPDLIGMTEQQATDALTAAGLHVSTVTSVIDDNHVGTVSATDPVAGTMLFATPDGGGVGLKIGSASPPVTVPSIIGQTPTEATQTLQNAGLELGLQFQVENIDNIGKIVDQNPQSGTTVARTTRIDHTVGTYTAGKVPAVEGMFISDATQRLSAAGLVSSESFASFGGLWGTVVSQTPAPGTFLSPGSTVFLTLDNGQS